MLIRYKVAIQVWSEDVNQVKLILIRANMDPSITYDEYMYLRAFAQRLCNRKFV